MPVTDITKDLEARSIVITAEFAAPVERVWQVYADPRQLERVWGPPSHPATVVDHIKRHGGDEAKFFDSDNLQSLCSTHHNSVKQSEERTGKPIRRVGPDGWPIE